MAKPFIGSAAVASGALTPYALRSRFRAVYPDVYLPRGVEPTATQRATAAWLWTHRRGVVAGQSAAALLGAKWVDAHKPAEIIHDNRHPPRGIRTWADRVADDEVQIVDDVKVTTPARTALDIACRYPLGPAVAAVDALARATHLKTADVDLLAERYHGRRGIRNARKVIDLVDPGAESPKETWLRLLVIRNGFPPPQTQIPVYDEHGALVAVVDMGWDDIKIALDYEGGHHRTPDKFSKDIHRHDAVTGLGWIDIRVTSRDTEGGIVRRLQAAWARRT
ncbi:hypothetical protein [Mycolicibacterium monacense]|uniref:hypothetical protein n=1 Tax=Mycolicibacterium monacense TaxID=85693 RepID=UPI0007EC1CF7|nr:hypothetical protein [Mycolicibacterium monacense]OBF51151.1 hypothetical protein A5778_17625 [Mycolicibacterium monacense]